MRAWKVINRERQQLADLEFSRTAYPDIFGKIGPNCKLCNEKKCEFESKNKESK